MAGIGFLGLISTITGFGFAFFTSSQHRILGNVGVLMVLAYLMFRVLKDIIDGE
jgi:uncharacterized membrane protein